VSRLEGRRVWNLTGHKVTFLRKGDQSIIWRQHGLLRVKPGSKIDGRTLLLGHDTSTIRVSVYRAAEPTELFCSGFRLDDITEEDVIIVSTPCGALLRDNPHLLPHVRFVLSPLGADPVNGRKGCKSFAYWRGL
jgi:hypothetical protein